ncbi:hypothetical protein F4692_002083 [Nocardioides cavernae]|uniref:HNH nuclease domain-containing protein n=1 Tax=Nocardioides cavernae TaxID=1921566 RepID=A0A7Y9H2V2_9ACTN|nr:DUF222 domain-containing protein [Nocardioides cavernae]NYE36950.1 hypothetical protein [Nocardioides cavernae]
MIETLERDAAEVDDDLSAAGLLASIRTARHAENAAAARQLDLAARWADLHPPESIHTAASFTVPGCEHEEPIAGPGTPLVAEFCIAELGAVLGISTTAAKRLVGHALELRHRLPRLHAAMQSGAVPAWRARSVAETTIHSSPALTVEAAAFVDAQVAAVAGRVGPAQLDRLVAEAIKRYDLAEADPSADPEDGWQHVDPRHATLHNEDVHYAGTMRFEAELDIADALDLDRALAHGAATLKALGSEASLDVRRSAALGDLARTQTALDLAFPEGGRVASEERAGASRPHLPPEGGRVAREERAGVSRPHLPPEGGRVAREERAGVSRPHLPPEVGRVAREERAGVSRPHLPPEGGRVAREERAGVSRPDLPPARKVVLHAHFNASPTPDGPVLDATGRLDEGQRLILLDHVKDWCADTRTKVTIRPVIDLNTELSTPAYEPTTRIREAVILRDQTCVFPWCTRSARRCDLDHVVPFDAGGPTSTSNLAPLCRTHHRLKTHSSWHYETTAPGTYDWTSPHGHRFRRDHTGTRAIRGDDPPDVPRPRRR